MPASLQWPCLSQVGVLAALRHDYCTSAAVTSYEHHLWRARMETLQHALKVAGDEEGLARLLDVSPGQVSRWVSGDEPVPLVIFLDALDLVARGRYGNRGALREAAAMSRASGA